MNVIEQRSEIPVKSLTLHQAIGPLPNWYWWMILKMDKDSTTSLKGDAYSPTYVLEDEGMSISEVPVVDAEDNDLLVHGEALEVSKDMVMEEKRLEEERVEKEKKEMENHLSNGNS